MMKLQTPFLSKAISLLKRGELVGMPTETVYGLAANAFDDGAVAKIYALKQRPSFNPLIAHVRSLEQAKELVVFTEQAHALARTFWPGPLTLVLPLCEGSPLSLLATAGLKTAAVRIPAHPVARELLDNLRFPLVAPSANPSESISPTTAGHVQGAFPDLYVLDGGECQVGLESTILDLSGPSPVLLRPGVLSPQDLEAVVGPILPSHPTPSRVTAPGQLKRHYAPSIPLRLNCEDVRPGEALLSFGPHGLTGFSHEINLSPTGDLQEAAARLFRALHELNDPRYTGIAVMAIPHTGIGLAINDRLSRGAS